MFLLRDIPTTEIILNLSKRYEDVDPAAMESCLALLVVAREVISAFEEHLGRYNLSQGRFNVLILLNRNPNSSLCPADLAERSGVTRATMTGLLDGLEREGLIQRIQDKEDRRRLGIVLTPEGRDFLDSMMPDHFQRISTLMAHLTVDERARLRELLDKISLGLPAIRAAAPEPVEA